ncbi:hypothetical protein Pen02_82900 [Plantactinospora endophytica]|uniref:Uncharacterized protein n=1 Tax=Plantactinospora endophytica TaxID=673535 RepID=A0ABQ4EF55_9ACTN|nr:hypothetical protein Pen02_82900 [Plantactinospora endophytica]
MTPAEEARIREAALARGRTERREQGIPEQFTDEVMTAELAVLLGHPTKTKPRPRTAAVVEDGAFGGRSENNGEERSRRAA